MGADTEAAAIGSHDTAHGSRPGRVTRRTWVQAALALALFGVGLIQGYRWAPDAPSSPVIYDEGALVATGALEDALYDPALGGREEGPSVGKAFTNKAGHSCRPFTDGRASGVACQRLGDWRVVELRQE